MKCAICWYRFECADVAVILVDEKRFSEAIELLPDRGFKEWIKRLDKAGIKFEFIPQDKCYEHIVEMSE